MLEQLHAGLEQVNARQRQNIEKLSSAVNNLNRHRNVNLYDVAGIASRELSYSSSLAWFLDPRENHGLGDTFLRKFLGLLGVKEFDGAKVSTEVTAKRRRIDILIEARKLKVCIENKVWDFPTVQQLKDEYEEFSPSHMVLIAPAVTLRNFQVPDFVTAVSYEQLHKILPKKGLIGQFAYNIEVNIMKQGFNDKAMLYAKYIDDINDVKKAYEDGTVDILNSVKGYIESLDKDIITKIWNYKQELGIYKNKWLGKECKVFILIELYPELVAAGKVGFRLWVENQASEKAAKLRSAIVKKLGAKFKKNDYKYANLPYELYSKRFKVGDYVEDIQKEVPFLHEVVKIVDGLVSD